MTSRALMPVGSDQGRPHDWFGDTRYSAGLRRVNHDRRGAELSLFLHPGAALGTAGDPIEVVVATQQVVLELDQVGDIVVLDEQVERPGTAESSAGRGQPS